MSRADSSPPSQDRFDDEAAAWFARRDAGFTAAEAAAFERWLAADPQHAAAWGEFERCLGHLDGKPGTAVGAEMICELGHRQRRRRRMMLTGWSMAVTATAAAVVFLLRPGTAPAPVSNRPAEAVIVRTPEQRTLPDGSIVDLNFGAVIELAFTPERRGVRLVQGTAHFAVAKDPTRSFVVAADGVEVRAVGTAFSVATSAETIKVVVAHGRVAVARSSAPSGPAEAAAPEPIVADAGMIVSISREAEPRVTTAAPAEVDRELAWRGPRLELSGTTLADAVSALNQKNRVQLRIDDRALAQLRLSGTFRADNAEGFVRVLEANYGVAVERSDSVITLRSVR